MSGRPPDQLAREVRDHINDSPDVDSTMALAALAELQAQAEAGRRLADERERWRAGLEIIAAGESRHFHVYAQNLLDGFHPYDLAREHPLAAAVPSPADQEEA